MADSAPDPEVEDVLSSVRRLISGEIPKRTETQKSPDSGALVLTASQRIEEEAPASPKPTASAQPPKEEPIAQSLEQRVAELEAAVDQGSQKFEPDGSEDQSQHRPDRIVYTRPAPDEEDAFLRRSTLRLSEIAILDKSFEGDVDPDEASATTDGEPIPFRHDPTDEIDEAAPESDLNAELAEIEEAPMAENVPLQQRGRSVVRRFADPDEEVVRIVSRIEMGEDDFDEADEENAATSESTNAADEFEADLHNAVRASMLADTPKEEANGAHAVEDWLGRPAVVADDIALDDVLSDQDEADDTFAERPEEVITRVLEDDEAAVAPDPIDAVAAGEETVLTDELEEDEVGDKFDVDPMSDSFSPRDTGDIVTRILENADESSNEGAEAAVSGDSDGTVDETAEAVSEVAEPETSDSQTDEDVAAAVVEAIEESEADKVETETARDDAESVPEPLEATAEDAVTSDADIVALVTEAVAEAENEAPADADESNEVAEEPVAELAAVEAEPAPEAEAAEAVAESETSSDAEDPDETDVATAALANLSDEEAMRLLVGRMIREELQGDLGERITRNVRKLVHREVLRALSARDLA